MKDRISIFVFLFIILVMTAMVVRFPLWIFAYDNLGFYMYLPQFFIYHDIGLTDFDVMRHINDQYNLTYTFYQFEFLPNGQVVDRFLAGIAILLTPFFLLGHLYALLSAFPADGYSEPYRWAIIFGGIFYAAWAFWLIRKILLKLFNDTTVALILIVFYLGTNIFFFTSLGNPLPHIFVFALYAALFYYTIRWHESFKWQDAARIGLSLGLLMITRPSEIIALIIPLVWGVYSKSTLRAKWELIIRHKKQIGVLILFTIVIGLPQLIYWLKVTGSPVYFPYTDAQSGMNLLQPRFFWVLFSFRKGWFLYTPLMLIIIPGFVILYQKHRPWFYAIFIYSFVNLYLIASFSSLVSYGFRAFIQSYTVLIIPFGLAIDFFFKQKIWIKILKLILIIGFVYLNIFQSWQWRSGTFDGTRMTGSYYWRVFLKNGFEPEDRDLLLIARPADGIDHLKNDTAYHHRIIYYQNFEFPEAGKEKNYTQDTASNGQYAFVMDSLTEYYTGLEKKYNQISQNYYCWFRVSVKLFPEFPLGECDTRLVVGFTYKGKVYKYRAVSIQDEVYGAKLHEWNAISMDYMSPEMRSRDDKLIVYIWHRGKKKILIDELKVEAFTLD